MTDEVTIRSVAPTDFHQWLALWEGYNVFYDRVGPAAVPAEVTKMTWARFFDSYEPVEAVVAERGGELIGLAHYIFHRNTTMLGPACYLQDLFTAEAARGLGIGRALINCVYDRARAAGFNPGLLANPQDERDGSEALRQSRRILRFYRLSEGYLTVGNAAASDARAGRLLSPSPLTRYPT